MKIKKIFILATLLTLLSSKCENRQQDSKSDIVTEINYEKMDRMPLNPDIVRGFNYLDSIERISSIIEMINKEKAEKEAEIAAKEEAKENRKTILQYKDFTVVF
jgi:hypothetical protein